MSDDRISESPNPPRCPVCATGFTATPGASCPACGRVFAPLPAPQYDLRRKSERFRLDGRGWTTVGGILVLGVLLVATQAPGILIPLVILVLPAIIRTARLDEKRPNNRTFSISATFLAALGVSILMGVAAGAACYAVCWATVANGGFGNIGPGIILGGITALAVFAALFAVFWPRADTSAYHDPGED